jgi:putative transposase
MDERIRFVARLLDGEKMAPLCRSFGISRKTGYKIFERYKTIGFEGLTHRSRRPYRQASQLPFQIESLIVSVKERAPKLGRAKDPRKAAAAVPRPAPARHQHRARSARSQRSGEQAQTDPPKGQRRRALCAGRTQ